ncbi:hypothetical protein TrVE_jg7574 [Triparma verrucosa]|uniref:HMA domain-containing protein n=1 Tax=Triparma verrucosa TaxID=1606542 RepID=A0A9W7BTS8_9STRA|nr:hypothetical protein TrVE_jg7574 [Triparma verrucosa]
MAKLHLVSDPGFLTKFSISLLTIILVSKVPPLQTNISEAHERLRLILLSTAHAHQLWFLISFLASSCCLLQVVLNMLSAGCGGFNTYLGPARPTFLALATFLQGLAWREAANLPFLRRPTFVSTIVTIVLSFSPELLMLSHGMKRQQQREDKFGASIVLSLGGSIGCASCVTTVKKIVELNQGISSCDMDSDNNAHVYLRKDVDKLNLEQELKAALTSCGFPPQPGNNKLTK